MMKMSRNAIVILGVGMILGALMLVTRHALAQAPTTTRLMYTYVTNQAGYDTGLAILNTTADPYGTTHAAGACKVLFYGTGVPATPFTTPVIAAGQNYEFLASSVAPGFQGYIIANCNFPFAHGFSFISTVGGGQSVGTNPAIVLSNPRTAPESQGN
jgi:hypothetical protein